jgi:exo-beta-1,3-glucanase (GH17 family)
VHWAGSYFVRPAVILKWVTHLQELKKAGEIPAATWITSSDNFASWGGQEAYHHPDLEALIRAVDYVSMHTYPFHDSHYVPEYWHDNEGEEGYSDEEKIRAAMQRARDHAVGQYESVASYMSSLGIEKPIHIGETGWASVCSSIMGPDGSGAADEFKQKLYYDHMREWTREADMSCFFFEAFDEPWKDDKDPMGSENHFGLIKLNGAAKYALWDEVDQGVFEGLTRNGHPITRSFGGDEAALMETVSNPK